MTQPAARTTGSSVSALRRWSHYDTAASGLTEYWYPVLRSSQLRGKKMKAVKVAGHELCLLRDQGRVHALLDRCPHRGVPLSIGSREFPGHVACIYHGWVFDLEDGVLKHALTDGPDSPIRGKICVRTYPAEERLGMIWVWTGEGEAPPLEEDLPEELLYPTARLYWRQNDVEGNWRYAAENGFDEAHIKMLHRPSWWLLLSRMPAWNRTDIIKSDDGKWLRRFQREVILQDDYPGLGRWPRFNLLQRRRKRVHHGTNEHTVDIRMPATLRVRQPGKANWTHYEWYVPIDDGHYKYTQLAVAWVSGVRRLTWALRYWTYILWIHHHGFNNQDREVVPLQGPDKPEHLFRPDVAITSWRAFVDKEHRTSDSASASRASDAG